MGGAGLMRVGEWGAGSPVGFSARAEERGGAVKLGDAMSLRRTDAGGWQVDAVKVSARWVVYVGKLAKGETLAKKTADLAALGIKAIPVANPDLQPGLVLAGFETEAAAKAELARLAPRGIRGIKVLQERQAATVQQLRVPAATEAIKLRLQDVKAALQGHGLKSCS